MFLFLCHSKGAVINHKLVAYIHRVRDRLVPSLYGYLTNCGKCPHAARADLSGQTSFLGGGKAKDLVDHELSSDNKASIIINTMPKSGSVYINAAMQAGLGFSPIQIHNMYFPDDVVNINALKEWASGARITQTHLSSTELNIWLLGSFVDRMIIHVRDPREATLSWVHFIGRMYRENPFELLRIPYVYPKHFMGLTFSERVDWAIDHHLPILVRWVDGWIKYSQQDLSGETFRVLFTTYPELVNDETALFAKICGFFDVPKGSFVHPNIDKSEAVYFRKGQPGEWRNVFSATQRQRATDLSQSILAHFGWQ